MEIINKKTAGDDVAVVEQHLKDHKESAQVPRDILHEAEDTALASDFANIKIIATDLQ